MSYSLRCCVIEPPTAANVPEKESTLLKTARAGQSEPSLMRQDPDTCIDFLINSNIGYHSVY